MKKIFCIISVLLLAFYVGSLSFAGEHGGKEHGGTGVTAAGAGKEHGGTAEKGSKGGMMEHAMPSADDIRQTMKDYILSESAETGSFSIYDKETGKTRRLALLKVHERVGKTGDYYYSCADFKDIDSGDLLDLDLDVQDKSGNLSVVDVRIHKLNGKRRYTYDEKDNRIPVPEE